MQWYYQDEPRFTGVYSRKNLSKIKDDAYVINLGAYKVIGTHSIALYVNDDNMTYFDNFWVSTFLKKL